jgi:hypothetical protein
MMLRATSSAIGIGSMAALSRAECAPWESGTSLPRQPHLGRMAVSNGCSDRSGASVRIILSSWERRICAASCEPTLTITIKSERTGHWIKMRRSLAPFSGSDPLIHTRSLADFITITCGFRFSVHTIGRTKREVPASIRGKSGDFVRGVFRALIFFVRTAAVTWRSRLNRRVYLTLEPVSVGRILFRPRTASHRAGIPS